MSNFSENVNATKRLLQEINQIQQNVTARIATLEEKLKSAKEKVAKASSSPQKKMLFWFQNGILLTLYAHGSINVMITTAGVNFKSLTCLSCEKVRRP